MEDLDKLSDILEALQTHYLAHKNRDDFSSKTMSEEVQHPASVATYWVSQWADDSDRYGIGKSCTIYNTMYILESVIG